MCIILNELSSRTLSQQIIEPCKSHTASLILSPVFLYLPCLGASGIVVAVVVVVVAIVVKVVVAAEVVEVVVVVAAVEVVAAVLIVVIIAGVVVAVLIVAVVVLRGAIVNRTKYCQ